MKKFVMILFLLVWGGLWNGVTAGHAADVTVKMTPQPVSISTFYNGTTVMVRGTIPASAEAVIRLSGEGEDLHLKKKGKVAGLLWMNTGDLTFHNAPRVYKLYTASALNDIGSSPAADFSFTALTDRIEISPAGEDKVFLISEFVRLKEEDGLYSQEGDTISYGAAQDGMKTYQTAMAIPPAMKQGNYTVELAVVGADGQVATFARPLELRQVGFPAQLTSMAFGHATWYGVMAVIIALVAGLFMGIVFKGKGGAH